MKLLAVLFSAIAFIITAACSKEEDDNAVLTGTWVGKTFKTDTLVVYRSNGRHLMLDNSDYYRRRVAGSFPGVEFFKHQYILKKDSIGLRSFNSNGPFFYYSFQWITYNQEFRMSYNGIRPYLSSIGFITYVRIK